MPGGVAEAALWPPEGAPAWGRMLLLMAGRQCAAIRFATRTKKDGEVPPRRTTTARGDQTPHTGTARCIRYAAVRRGMCLALELSTEADAHACVASWPRSNSHIASMFCLQYGDVGQWPQAVRVTRCCSVAVCWAQMQRAGVHVGVNSAWK